MKFEEYARTITLGHMGNNATMNDLLDFKLYLRKAYQNLEEKPETEWEFREWSDAVFTDWCGETTTDGDM